MVRKARRKKDHHHDENEDDSSDDDDDNRSSSRGVLFRSTSISAESVIRETVVDGGEMHQQAMLLRDKEERTPMTPRQRASIYVKQRIPGLGDDEPTPVASRRQYKVQTSTKWSPLCWKPVNPDDFSYAPNGLIVWYINWTFRSGFGMVFLTFLLIFFVMVFLFGVLFKFVGEAEPECIVVAGDPFGFDSPHTTLADGFALSWTTFTTVGYGAVYTATGNDTTGQQSCVFITLLCTIESFVGLLYAGICTAIMFGKIGRIQSHAQVIFSDALCIEYGKVETSFSKSKKERSYRGYLSDRGIMSAGGVLSEIPINSISGPPSSLRSFHSRHHHTNKSDCRSLGGILNSHSSSDWRKEEGTLLADGSSYDHDDDDNNDNDNDDGGRIYSDLGTPPVRNDSKQKLLCPVLKFQLVNQLANQPFGEILDAQMNVMVRKEQESYPYEPIARFLKVELEEPHHPFFNRVWHGRHVLDEQSPLVSVEARELIRRGGGYWPSSLNSVAAIKHHLRFSSLIVTMTGISNISAEAVQIAKRYYRPDVLVGYEFAPILFQSGENQQLYVDMKLVHDVIEQAPSNSTNHSYSSPPQQQPMGDATTTTNTYETPPMNEEEETTTPQNPEMVTIQDEPEEEEKGDESNDDNDVSPAKQ
mmetsp:Transcript_28398/g.42933  ORF Transcript_28398/g.42933 Transcript_28398/m.42933 type:complete len:644 (+) Transcript_28398:171-2102(+)|eukprot:CAMPEP_0178904024 /NCGR_PEP_ID=MMETSP0786-20121207/5476_1 /TAXON_ID=186022 /ORGANISM="Thalassionema frauenfeldii, Strain CCMP 1798" /LENGTH=643 /DNA_ID=CAMNT_0020575447 /DNA_START=55 /DNA_END=1986 /DNA_ORIENTATION=-